MGGHKSRPYGINMMDTILHFFSDYTVLIVLAGSVTLGITAGTLGCFAFLRRQSLLGDAVAHATLPGVCLAFIITGSKSPIVLMIGAALAGWIGTLLMGVITDNTRIKRDAALGIILSVFFGFGLVLLTLVQRMATASKAGLDKFLFGNAATLLREDVIVMLVLSAIIFTILLAFWKEFKLIVFDPDYARSTGVNIRAFDILLTSLIVAAIVIGLQTVGVVLMSAMLVAPAAAARQWTDRLSVMILLAAIFGAVSGAAGAVTSSMMLKLPTGPTIVVYLSVIVMISIFLAPNRGLLWDLFRYYQQRRKIQMTAVLKNMMLYSEFGTNPFHPHDVAALEAVGRGAIGRTLRELEDKGFIKETSPKMWAFTPEGVKAAKVLSEEFEGEINESV